MTVSEERAKRLRRLSRQAAEATVARDQLIVEAYLAGGGLREIARLVGLTHPGVLRILRRDLPKDAP
jgi:hypothetical protein